jgi:hypothetical protein
MPVTNAQPVDFAPSTASNATSTTSATSATNATSATRPQAPPAINRCRARTRSNSRCRLHANPHSELCPRHSLRPTDRPEDLDLSSHFGTQVDDLSTAVHINAFITTLIRLIVKNEISTRRAAVLGYLTNQLLRSVPAVDRELNPDSYGPPQIIFDIPRPSNDAPPDPRDADRPMHNSGILATERAEKRDEPHAPYDGWPPPKEWPQG